MIPSAGRGLANSDQAISWILLALSTPFLIGAVLLGYQSAWYRLVGAQASGEIVAVSGDVPVLLVEFETEQGERRRLRSAGSDLYANYAVGDRVQVLYDPEQVADARLNLFVEMWLFPVLLGAFGGFLALFLLFVGLPPLPWRPLSRVSVPVEADYLGWRLEFDRSLALAPLPAKIELRRRGQTYELLQDGLPRDPLDPVVQRELGLGYVAILRGSLPGGSRPLMFESHPLPDNPDRRVRQGRVRVHVDPRNLARYVIDPPLGPGLGQKGPGTRSSVVRR